MKLLYGYKKLVGYYQGLVLYYLRLIELPFYNPIKHRSY